jgi:O-acetylhomoserine/O-acetylserine sulfhydrylase-like pyridoxal-dependent enzyme
MQPLHPETRGVTEGFDPRLSVMAARPPIYPVSTFAFKTAEEAAHWFDVLARLAADLTRALDVAAGSPEPS